MYPQKDESNLSLVLKPECRVILDESVLFGPPAMKFNARKGACVKCSENVRDLVVLSTLS